MTDLKEKFNTDPNISGAWLSIGHPTVAEITASQGFDFVLIDTEHTPIDLETVGNMCRGVNSVGRDTATIVRVPANDHVRIKRVLDIGVSGVMVPMVESAEEASRIVDAVNYPPVGNRGIASGRAAEYGDNFQQYVKSANGSIFTIAQIETQAGLDNAAEIAAVGEIDSIFVGPADLSANLGVFGEWESDRLTAAIEGVLSAGKAEGTPVGTLVIDPDHIETRIEQGFDYLIVGKDTNHLSTGNRSILRRYKNSISQE